MLSHSLGPEKKQKQNYKQNIERFVFVDKLFKRETLGFVENGKGINVFVKIATHHTY